MKILTNKYIKIAFSFITLMLIGARANAQDMNSLFGDDITSTLLISFILLVLVLVLVVAIYLLQILRMMVEKDGIKLAQQQGIEPVDKPSSWSKFWASLSDAVPIEDEASVQLDHNYDGIRELDNHLPPWWKWMFYISVVFGVVYMFIYHVFNIMPLQNEEYDIAMANAAAVQSSNISEEVTTIDESSISFSNDPEVLASGQTIYQRNCVACHKAAGEGGIGPNLTDEYWLHGGSVQEVYNTIKNGVPDKGMIAWKDVLSPSKINDVNSYIYTLRGTAPANPKAAQGDAYKEPIKVTTDSIQ